MEPHDGGLELSPDDASALDALLGETAHTNPSRAARLDALLGLLDVDPAGERTTLIDVAMARVMREHGEPVLMPDDEEALDAWVTAGYRDARVAPSLRERARRHEALAALVTAESAIDSNGLVDATLDRVQAAIDVEEGSLQFDVEAGGGRRLRLADVVSVAAVLLIGFSVVWPIFSNVRQKGQVASCLSHFQTTASAMGAYAGSNMDQLPMATASLGGAWWDVDPKKPQSNSANLFELTRGEYADLTSLSCPGNAHAPTASWDRDARDWRNLDEISFSYQIMFGPERPSWTTRRTVVLTDRSPVILRAYRREIVDPMANSPNHNGKGQHMLYTDGSVQWAKTPVMENGNNIWLPSVIEQAIEKLRRGELDLRGTEFPGSAQDVFVGP